MSLSTKTGWIGEMSPADLGPALRAYRKAQGLTLSQVSDRTGIGISNLSHYENGNFLPSADNLLVLASFLGVELSVDTHDTMYRLKETLSSDPSFSEEAKGSLFDFFRASYATEVTRRKR
jgi:transcriptional regulator with XRE-family HTH domain